jgi:hypothetical protein
VDGKTGNLTSHDLNTNPSEEECYKRARLRLDSVFEIEKHEAIREFMIDFGYTGDSHCVEFPLPRYSNITLNVTMPSPIANFTLGNYPEIVIYNYTQGNSLIARIRVYPCCGIKNMTMQKAEVCS